MCSKVLLDADRMERRRDHGDLGDMLAQVVDKAKEALQLLDRGGNRPLRQIGVRNRVAGRRRGLGIEGDKSRYRFRGVSRRNWKALVGGCRGD